MRAPVGLGVGWGDALAVGVPTMTVPVAVGVSADGGVVAVGDSAGVAVWAPGVGVPSRLSAAPSLGVVSNIVCKRNRPSRTLT